MPKIIIREECVAKEIVRNVWGKRVYKDVVDYTVDCKKCGDMSTMEATKTIQNEFRKLQNAVTLSLPYFLSYSGMYTKLPGPYSFTKNEFTDMLTKLDEIRQATGSIMLFTDDIDLTSPIVVESD